ncbi:RND family transporter [uncultured Methanolobus sp.]|uniref:RND family transporter n=1 Tax=uncultured Methanolobus sp. TaxID=218300 RepID=UPI002AAAAFAA|nr:RND family transporter [uncultured Methanolobus sp.]
MSAKDVYGKIGYFIEKWPKGIILVAILLIIIAIQGAGLIEQKSGIDTFVSKDSDIYLNYDHLYKQNFGNDLVLVLVDSDDATDSEVLETIDDFDGIIGTDKNVETVMSMASLVKDAAYFVTGRNEIPNDDTIQAIIAQLPSAYVDQLLPDSTHTIIMVQMTSGIDEDNKKRVLNQVNRALDTVDFPAGTTAVATGDPAFLIAMSEEMSSSLQSMLLLAFILMILALLVVFHHVRWCLLPLPVVLVGLVWTFGAMGYMDIPMTMATMAVFPILIGLGADYAIQFHNRLEEELAKGESVEGAVIDTIKHTGPAVGTAVVATSLGFVALFISSVPMIQDFGKISLIGVILCYIASMFVLVSILYLLDRRYEKKACNPSGKNIPAKKQVNTNDTAIGRVLKKVSMFSAKRPLIVISLALILAVSGLYADEKVGVQTDTKDFVPQDMLALQNLEKLTRVMGGIDQINIIVKADDIKDPDVLQWMVDFSQREVEDNSHITDSGSIASLIYSAYGSIPTDEDTVDYIIDSMSSAVTGQYIEGGNMGVINLDLDKDLSSEQISSTIDQVESDLEWYIPPAGVSVTVTGSKVTTTSIIDALTSGRTQMGYLGMAIIFLGMLIIYKDWLKALATILPIVMVTGWIGGVMYLLDMSYNPLTATLGALAIGIGAEFTILMLERYFEEREKGLEPYDALETAASSIGPAIIASGSTVIFGFSALIISSFPMISAFGKVTVIAVAFSLVSTVVVLPPIMVNLDLWRSGRKTSEKHIESNKVSI